MFVYDFVYPELLSSPSLFEFGQKSPLGTFLISFFLFFCLFLALGGVSKGLKDCSKNFNIVALMHRGKAKFKSPRRGGIQRRREGEPDTLYNREDIQEKLDKCKDM